MNMEDIIPSEMNQTQKEKEYVTSACVWDLKRKNRHETELIVTESRMVVTKGWGMGEKRFFKKGEKNIERWLPVAGGMGSWGVIV